MGGRGGTRRMGRQEGSGVTSRCFISHNVHLNPKVADIKHLQHHCVDKMLTLYVAKRM